MGKIFYFWIGILVMIIVVFFYGKESGLWGSKIIMFLNVVSDMGFGVESIDY